MWSLSDKYAVFMLLWMIACAVSSGGFVVVFALFSIAYALLSAYYAIKECKQKGSK